MKKFTVLFVLFVVPLAAYLFIIQGKINFEPLPVLNEEVIGLNAFQDENQDLNLIGKISVVSFLGTDFDRIKMGVLNLNQIIYKKLVKYKDFQIVVIVPEGSEEEIVQLKSDLTFMVGTDLNKWKFVFGSKSDIIGLHNDLKVNTELTEYLGNDKVYLIDMNGRLRGRIDEEDGIQYGYNMFKASVLKNELLDDVKVVFYEYNSSLKKFESNRDI
jgi:hypothetical protein